jgi:propane monooxygenase small subunit
MLQSWFTHHGGLAVKAALQLQPLWSLPRVKAANFVEAFERARGRVAAIGREIGIDADLPALPPVEVGQDATPAAAAAAVTDAAAE